MDDSNLIESLGQVSSNDAGIFFRDFLRGGVRQMICEVMAAEVSDLCGPKHHPNEGDYVRAGSSSGRVIAFDEREDLVRPRVRRKDESGKQEGVQLATHHAANDPEALTASIIQAVRFKCFAQGRVDLAAFQTDMQQRVRQSEKWLGLVRSLGAFTRRREHPQLPLLDQHFK